MMIGSGPAPTVDPIIKYFDEFIFIEPNKFFTDKYKSYSWYRKCIKLNKKVIIISSVIEDLVLNIHSNSDKKNKRASKYKHKHQYLSPNSIDFIVSSHVAYYYPNEYMTNIMAFLLSLLKQDTGIMTTGVSDDHLDLAVQLMKKVEPRYKCSDLIEASLNNLNMKYTKLMEYVEYKMDSIEELKQTLLFFVCEGSFNKNWFDGDRLTSERMKEVDDIISDAMKDDIIKDVDGNYIDPNHNVHYVVEMAHNSALSSRL